MSRDIKTITSEESAKLVTLCQTQVEVLPDCTRCYRDRLIVFLMLDAGLRVGEASQLLIADLYRYDEPVASLVVRNEISKSGKDRTVPMTARCIVAIDEMFCKVWHQYPDTSCIFAFSDKTGKNALSVRQIQRIVQDMGLIAFNKEITPHMLRHTFATRLIRNTNIRVVQKLLGHASLTSTQVYLHPDAQDLKEAIQSLDS